MALPSRTVTEYAELGLALLPRGPFWDLLRSTWLDALVEGLATEWARVDARWQDLLDESDPRTADETLAAWERNAGLPVEGDPSPPTTTADRQAALWAAWVATGGQSPAYYIEVAAALGVTVTITERPYGDAARAEVTTSEEPANAYAAPFYWLVDGPTATGADLQDRLEALITRLAPAHTTVEFTWTA